MDQLRLALTVALIRVKPPNISLDEFIRQMINTIHKEDLHFFHLFHLSNNSPGQDAADVEEKTKILLEWKNVRQRATLAEHECSRLRDRLSLVMEEEWRQDEPAASPHLRDLMQICKMVDELVQQQRERAFKSRIQMAVCQTQFQPGMRLQFNFYCLIQLLTKQSHQGAISDPISSVIRDILQQLVRLMGNLLQKDLCVTSMLAIKSGINASCRLIKWIFLLLPQLDSQLAASMTSCSVHIILAISERIAKELKAIIKPEQENFVSERADFILYLQHSIQLELVNVILLQPAVVRLTAQCILRYLIDKQAALLTLQLEEDSCWPLFDMLEHIMHFNFLNVNGINNMGVSPDFFKSVDDIYGCTKNFSLESRPCRQLMEILLKESQKFNRKTLAYKPEPWLQRVWKLAGIDPGFLSYALDQLEDPLKVE